MEGSGNVDDHFNIGKVLVVLPERDHEPELFFLIPISALLNFCGILTFLITGVRNTIFLFRSQRKGIRHRHLTVTCGCTGMVLGYASALAFLVEANSGRATMPVGIVCAAAALACIAAAVILRISAGKYEE